MQDLQSQLDKLQKLIQLKDAQLAKLQGQLGADGQGAAQPNAALPDASQPNAAARRRLSPGLLLRQRRLLLQPEKHPPLRRSLGGAAARASCREASGTCRSGARSGTGGRAAGTELPRRTAGQPAVVGGDRR